MSAKLAKKIMEHPDASEIITKLLSNVPNEDINEWLVSKYTSVGESKFILSNKDILIFKRDYLDFYSIIKDDVNKTKSNLSYQNDLKEEIQGSPLYHKSLELYINNEVDIKTTVKKMVAAMEIRASQVFDQIQEDPRNIKMDRTLIEWFNALTAILEKYDVILNGNPDQINIQNNINIQVVDQHINVVYDIIKEILEKLDYDTSLLFVEMFTEKMNLLKSKEDRKVLPVEERLEEAKILSASVNSKLEA